MKAKAKAKCFYKGRLYKEGQVKDFPVSHKKDDDFKAFFEVIEKPKKTKESESDSSGDSESSSAEAES